jgi:SNF2 family DNA or RNA helicase
MFNRSDLHKYQNRTVAFIKDKRRVFLCIEMGLGKTVSTLTAISDLSDCFMINKVLVIAPLRVAKSVWTNEVNEWEHLKHLNVVDCTGAENKRSAALMQPSQIFTINRENVKWLVDYMGDRWDFDFVVVDESSSFKNPTSQRFKALKKILPKTEYIVLLTGTPSPNGFLDLWSQVYLIDFGHSLSRTMTGYKQRFFESDFMGYKFNLVKGADKIIQSLIRPFTLSLSTADYLELPERIDLYECVDMPTKSKTQYDEFERDLLIELDDDQEVLALSAATLANKLLQWSNGAVYVDDKQNYVQTHNVKIDALIDIVESNDENMLVAYNYKSDLARIKKQFPDAVLLDKNQETINLWNEGKIKMLLAHPASAGHGLNLQKGGSLCVWFGLNWSLELYQQFNARLHRQGQTKPVRIVHIVSNGTIDERLIEVLAGKNKTQADLISALKVKVK